MRKIDRFVIWICSKFTRSEIESIIKGLSDVLANRNPDVKPKDDFKEKHPHFRDFFVDPNPPLTESPKPTQPKLYWKELLADYHFKHGHPLQPVNPKNSHTLVPKNSICHTCSAPSDYLYFNDGKKRQQIKCKVCSSLSQVHPRHRKKAKFFCPYCLHPLFLWKQRKDVNIYKCDYDKCRHFLYNKKKLNFAEKLIRHSKSSQFKLRYQFREYLFTEEQLAHSAPAEDPSGLFNIHNSLNTLCLILTFHISLAVSARKTAFILKNVFSVPCSYQTVLNYSQSAAYLCHKFNLAYKGDTESTQAGDETYIKILGENNYTFFFICPESRKITSYHIADSRDTLPATASILEAIRTAPDDKPIIIITDGNPSYIAGILYINQNRLIPLSHKKVIGLQNLDSESEEFRPFKQLIERLIRTYKFHTRAACGFNSTDGAIALTTLFVTHYNFLRPHSSLGFSVPIPLKELSDIKTIQGKWAEILQMAGSLN
jgi:transposase-like protein